ncbi:hypothetical protein AAULR_03794 [Lacticaseibacillus rhamnosus MTCC 5462]|nr:hypothetical protein AAULR_03794 [Lacticaseibacillus rhamnosus MTCC 5462]
MRDAWRYYWFQAQVNATTMVNGVHLLLAANSVFG